MLGLNREYRFNIVLFLMLMFISNWKGLLEEEESRIDQDSYLGRWNREIPIFYMCNLSFLG